MYKVTLEGDDTVIRIKRELMDQATVSRLLDLVNLAAVLEKSRFAEAKEKILARMLGFPTGVALLRDPALNKDAAFTEEEREHIRAPGAVAGPGPNHGRASDADSGESPPQAERHREVSLYDRSPGPQ